MAFFFYLGEDQGVTNEMTAPWRETTLSTIISRYGSRDIYNADEFGLFYKELPTKSMYLKSEKCSGGKNSKIRMTHLAAANMCGEKVPMFVIGKSNKPHCFKGIKSTPYRYRAQKKSWMDSKLFEEWVREQDRKFALEVRKVALIIDNCIVHLNIENLKSRALYFLPPSTTFCLQPMDQEVIRSLKCKYHNCVIKTIINAIDNGKQMSSISILEAMKMLAHTWSEVSESTVINHFRKAGFKEGVSNEDDNPFSAFKNSVHQLRQRESYSDGFTYKHILTVDDDTAVMGGVMTDDEIAQDLIEVAEEEVQEEDEEVTDKDNNETND